MTNMNKKSIDQRRAFLIASATGLAGLSCGLQRPLLANTFEKSANPLGGGKAKSVILFFLCGGSSHIDMWDLKPDAPSEYRGPFAPIATSANGVMVSEHLPLTAKQMHHLAVVLNGYHQSR